MADDLALNETVLLGGYDPKIVALGPTWVYSSGNWTDIASTLSRAPTARWGSSLVRDPPFKGLVLFGGRSTQTYSNDRWVLTSVGWQDLSNVIAPSPRAHCAMANDPGVKGLVLFGGGNGNAPIGSMTPFQSHNDTCTLTGSRWSNVTSEVAGDPGGRDGAVMVYAPSSHEVVLTQGGPVLSGGAVQSENDTWEFAGTSW